MSAIMEVGIRTTGVYIGANQVSADGLAAEAKARKGRIMGSMR
jgi:hypothetical protein